MKNKSDKSRIFINSVLTTGTTVIEKFIFIIINILIARYLTLENYGEYTTALGYATFFAAFVNLGINFSLVRAINLESHYENEHISNSLIIRSILFFLTYSAMAVSLLFTNYNTNTIYLIFLFGLVRIGSEYLYGLYMLYDAKEKFLISSSYTLIYSILFVIGTKLVIELNGNYFHFGYVRLLIIIILIFSIFIYTSKSFKLKFNKDTFISFYKVTIPFALQLIYFNFLQQTGIIVLSLMKGTIYSGIFYNAVIFIVTLQFIPGNIARVLIPYLYKISIKDNRDKFQFTFDVFSKFFLILSFYLFIVFYLYSSKILVLLFGDKYIDSIPILRIFSFSIPLMFNIASVMITGLDKYKKMTQILGIAALINLVLNIVFIYFYNAEGAAFAAFVTNLFIFTSCHLYLRKNRYVLLGGVIKISLKIIITVATCLLIKEYIFTDYYWVFSLIIVSMIYLVLIFVMLIRKDDIRIIKETLGYKK